MCGNIPFLFSWRAGFFSPPSCRQAQRTDLFRARDVCVHVFVLPGFERTMLWRPTANPKSGIPGIVMRKQTFLHLKWVTGQVWPQQPSELVWPCNQDLLGWLTAFYSRIRAELTLFIWGFTWETADMSRDIKSQAENVCSGIRGRVNLDWMPPMWHQPLLQGTMNPLADDSWFRLPLEIAVFFKCSCAKSFNLLWVSMHM